MTVDFDLNTALTELHHTTRDRVATMPVASVARRARHRRVLKRTGYSAVGTVGAAAIAFGAMTFSAPTPPPPAVTPTPTETATPTPTPTPTPSPSTTPAPGVAWNPNLSRCGMAGTTWAEAVNDPDAPVWVGAYWGPDPVDGTDAWTSRSDAIWPTDLGGQTMTVEVLDAVVIEDHSDAAAGTVGDVVAVLGERVAPFEADLLSGSEGGGSGSSGLIELDVPLAVCGDASLPDGEYLTVTRYRLTAGDETVEVYGASYQQLGDVAEPEPAAAAEPGSGTATQPAWLNQSLQPIPAHPFDLDLARCGGSVGTYAAAARTGADGVTPDAGIGWYFAGEAGTTIDIAFEYAYDPGLPAPGSGDEFAILDLVIAEYRADDSGIDLITYRGSAGPVVAVLGRAVTPFEFGARDWPHPVTLATCDGGDLPEGNYVAYGLVQANLDDSTSIFWAQGVPTLGHGVAP